MTPPPFLSRYPEPIDSHFTLRRDETTKKAPILKHSLTDLVTTILQKRNPFLEKYNEEIRKTVENFEKNKQQNPSDFTQLEKSLNKVNEDFGLNTLDEEFPKIKEIFSSIINVLSNKEKSHLTENSNQHPKIEDLQKKIEATVYQSLEFIGKFNFTELAENLFNCCTDLAGAEIALKLSELQTISNSSINQRFKTSNENVSIVSSNLRASHYKKPL